MPDLNATWAVATADSTSASDAAWHLSGLEQGHKVNVLGLLSLCKYFTGRWVFDGDAGVD